MGLKILLGVLLNGLISNPIVDPVFNLIENMADEMDDLLPDLREINPDHNIAEQVMDLVLDKIEDKIRDHFGSTTPHINLSVDFTFSVPVAGTQHIHIALGRINIPLATLLNLVRDTIRELDFYHDKLNNACIKLGEAFGKRNRIGCKTFG